MLRASATVMQQFIVSNISTRNSSADEVANVNFLYNDIVHAVQNTIDSCIHSATDRRGYFLENRFTKFSEITQCNGHYAVQGHSTKAIEFIEITRRLGLLRRSRSCKVTEFGTNRKLICDFLLVIITNLAPILHRFRDRAFNVQNRYIRLPLLSLTPPTERFPWDDLCQILPACQGMAIKWRRNTAENFNTLSRGHERYRRQTDRRQRDGRTTTFAKKEEKKHSIGYSSNIVKNGVLYG